jgi:hypothetical protein
MISLTILALALALALALLLILIISSSGSGSGRRDDLASDRVLDAARLATPLLGPLGSNNSNSPASGIMKCVV